MKVLGTLGILFTACFISFQALAQAQTSPQRIFSASDPSSLGLPSSVSIGHGGAFFAGYRPMRLDLYAAQEGGQNSLWSESFNYWDLTATVEFAKNSPKFYLLHASSNGGTKHLQLRKYGVLSNVPLWVADLPQTMPTNDYFKKILLSENGQKIFVTFLSPNESKIYIYTFAPGSNVPIGAPKTITSSGLVANVHLSRDGSRMLVRSMTMAHVLDTATWTTLALFSITDSSVECSAFNGSGTAFALGGFNSIKIFEQQASGSFGLTHTRTLPGQVVCNALAFSPENSTLAFAMLYWDTNLRQHIEAIDVASKATTMTHESEGTGTYQNVTRFLKFNSEGSIFALGSWGDQGNTPAAAEVRLYSPSQNAPLFTDNLSGSVFGLDLVDVNGNAKMVISSKAVHANVGDGHGTYHLYDLGGNQLTVAGLASGPLTFTAYGTPGRSAYLLISESMAAIPTDLGSLGLFYLTNPFVRLPMGTFGPDGKATVTYTLPPGAGTTRVFQSASLPRSSATLGSTAFPVTRMP